MLLESLKGFAVPSEALHRKLQVKTKPRGVDLASSIRMLWCLDSHFPVMERRTLQMPPATGTLLLMHTGDSQSF